MSTDKKHWKSWSPSEAIDLVAELEGKVLDKDGMHRAYRCPAGVLTVGYGHTSGVKETDRITEEQARELLIEDLTRFADAAGKYVTAWLNVHQYIALMSFLYNVGLTNFRRSSVVRLHNAGAKLAAADAFLLWKFAGGKPILLKRRTRERKEYLK